MGNHIWIFLCILFAVLATTLAQRNVIARVQSINLEEVVKNDRLFNNFYKCLMDEGRCPADAQSLKSLAPEIIKTKCAKCTDAERLQIKKSINLVRKSKPEQFKNLISKYDPEGVWKELAQ